MIKGIGRLNRRYSTWQAENNKKKFTAKLESLIENLGNRIAEKRVPFHLVSFSGHRFLADQVYSILSFYNNVDLPESWTVFDDGTYTDKEIELLQKIPGLSVIRHFEMEEYGDLPVAKFPTLKKIILYKSVKITGLTTIFVDSDVLFYPCFKNFITALQKNNWFLVDENYGYFDKSYLDKMSYDMYPCNLGLFILNTDIEWNQVIRYIQEKKQTGEIHYWSDQTAFHLLTRGYEKFLPLDPRYFVVSGSDSFKIGFDYSEKKIAVRHFVGPVRHKMWQVLNMQY